MIKNLLFSFIFLFILNIITYCSHNIILTSKISLLDEFDPTCRNGTASTEKVSVENTENCASCDTDYALSSVGNFMECRVIPYVCTNGDEASADGNAPNSNIENCARCDVGYVLTDVESFKECTPLDTDNDGKPDNTFHDVPADVDADGDGLIEIHTLNDLATIRYDLDGSGLDDDSSKMRTLGKTGCGGLNNVTVCTGYELTRNLDFADNASYVGSEMNMSWRPLNTSTFVEGSSMMVLADNGINAGWIPIGDCNGDTTDLDSAVCGDSDDQNFSATFEGNGFTISNLYARDTDSTGMGLGLFSATGSASNIRNVGLVEYTIFGSVGNDSVGGLVGYNQGRITASYATGNADGGDGNNDIDFVGGLVGYSYGGRITASYATGNADGGVGNDYVGGLVGYNQGRITASYATGSVVGGGGNDRVGGLVGESAGGIAAGIITASYATGSVVGDVGDDNVGGLVGYSAGNSSTIASYARGSADGGDGNGNDSVGGLLGYSSAGTTIKVSYAFGAVIGAETTIMLQGTRLTDVTIFTLTKDTANTDSNGDIGTAWNIAWDFGDGTEPPALKYADYDGMGSIEYCAMFPVNVCAMEALLPGPNENERRP